MKYRGIGKERICIHVQNGKIPVWDSSVNPWKKVYITEEEYMKYSKELENKTTIEIPNIDG